VRPLPASGVRRILIRANNWIGDVVMISPAVRAIREHFQDARIAIVAKSWVLETLRGHPDYDDLIEYDDRGRHGGLWGRARLAGELRRARFDLAVLFQKAFEAAVLAALAGARIRVGYATDRRSLLLTHPLPLPPRGTHHVEQFLGIARALGCPVRDSSPSFFLDDSSRRSAESLLGASDDPASPPLVAFHPGASKGPRAWHEDRFAGLGIRLAQAAGARIVLLGDRSEAPLLERIRRRLPAAPQPLTAAGVSIKEVGGILERCSLFVGNDSGPMHIAAALGVPSIGIFGPGSPDLTAPRARPGRFVAISRRYPCSPCRQNYFRECAPAPSGKPFCLEEIHVEEVAEEALRLLAGADRPSR
jgi:lipopolysaccharide heptosyltransferase II